MTACVNTTKLRPRRLVSRSPLSSSPEPIIAELDRTLVQRAVGNLVSNAVAHTPPGGSVLLAPKPEGHTVRIEVTDTGVGIPAEALPRVFDRFFRVDSSRSQASGGTGLGLAIVQSIMVLHGGKAKLPVNLGKALEVSLHLPVPAKTTKCKPLVIFAFALRY